MFRYRNRRHCLLKKIEHNKKFQKLKHTLSNFGSDQEDYLFVKRGIYPFQEVEH